MKKDGDAAIRTTSAEAILGLLSLRPMSGYQLRKLIEESIGNFWRESYGQIYPTLKRLAAEGLVRVKIEPGKRAAERKIYKLSKAGENRVREWLLVSPQEQVPRNELLLKLFFGRLMPITTCISHVRVFRAVQEERLKRYEATEAALKTNYAKHQDLPYWLMTLNYGQHEAQAMIKWCDETLS